MEGELASLVPELSVQAPGETAEGPDIGAETQHGSTEAA